MAMVQQSAFCNTCQAPTLHQKQKVNHVLHLILTFVTLGLWSLVWIVLLIVNSSQRALCSHCGRPVGAPPVHGQVPPGIQGQPQQMYGQQQGYGQQVPPPQLPQQ